MGMAVRPEEIAAFLDKELDISSIEDESKNGLQVWAPAGIEKVALAVDTSMETFRKAWKKKCQMIVVHHGLIWGGIKSVKGVMYDRIKFLLDREMALYAAHLPLDKHPEFGNNIQLCRLLGLSSLEGFGSYHGTMIGLEGVLPKKTPVQSIADLLREKLSANPLVLSFGKKMVLRVGVVSGSGSAALSEAIDRGLDCFVTGDANYASYHEIADAGINVIFAGHYATETPGLRALESILRGKFQIGTVFIDIPPPV